MIGRPKFKLGEKVYVSGSVRGLPTYGFGEVVGVKGIFCRKYVVHVEADNTRYFGIPEDQMYRTKYSLAK